MPYLLILENIISIITEMSCLNPTLKFKPKEYMTLVCDFQCDSPETSFFFGGGESDKAVRLS